MSPWKALSREISAGLFLMRQSEVTKSQLSCGSDDQLVRGQKNDPYQSVIIKDKSKILIIKN